METKLDQQRTDYTEGSVIRSILIMGLPSMLGFLAQHVYVMADMFWISELPNRESGIAALTFFNQVLMGVFAFNQLVGPGSVAVISRRYGQKLFNEAEAAIKETFLLKFVLGLTLAAITWFWLPEITNFLGAEGEAYQLSVSYGRIMLYGMPIMFVVYSVFTALRGVANPQMSMYIMIGSNILNIVLDPFFIFGWGPLPAFGVDGAAIASVVSFTITLITGLVLFWKGPVNVRLHTTGPVQVTAASMWQIVRIGIPSFFSDLMFTGSRLLVVTIIASFGTQIVAAYGTAGQLFAFGIMVLVGMGLGVSSLVGHNLGADKKKRAKSTADTSIGIGVGVMTVFGVLVFIFGRLYFEAFFSDSETVGYGMEIMRIWVIAFPFVALYLMLSQIHLGVGLNTPTMIITGIHSWLFQFVPAWILVHYFGYNQTAVWWIFAISGCVTGSLFYLYYRRGYWLEKEV